jgi:hypothetical protein
MSIKNTTLTTEEQAEYYHNIDRCSDGAIDQPISNALPEHARYLMTKMFSVAIKQIRLYSGRLEQSVYSRDMCEASKDNNADGTPVAVYSDHNLLSAVRGFLSKDNNCELRILVQTGVDGGIESHPLLSLISEMRNNGSLLGKVEIRQLKEKHLKGEHFDVFEHHFMVMDSTAYRFEFDHNPCRAQANFGDSKTAKSLAELFDDFLFPAGTSLVAI